MKYEKNSCPICGDPYPDGAHTYGLCQPCAESLDLHFDVDSFEQFRDEERDVGIIERCIEIAERIPDRFSLSCFIEAQVDIMVDSSFEDDLVNSKNVKDAFIYAMRREYIFGIMSTRLEQEETT